MAKGWEYAELSKTVSKQGGPEMYVESLIQSGKALGKAAMYPFLGLSSVLGFFVGIALKAIYDKTTDQKAQALVQADVAGTQLIEEIKAIESSNKDSTQPFPDQSKLSIPQQSS